MPFSLEKGILPSNLETPLTSPWLPFHYITYGAFTKQCLWLLPFLQAQIEGYKILINLSYFTNQHEQSEFQLANITGYILTTDL